MDQKPSFKYSHSHIGCNFGVTITGASEEMQRQVKRFMTYDYVNDPDYQIRSKSGAFLQGHDEQGGWMFIEFWTPADRHMPAVARLLEIFTQVLLTEGQPKESA